MKFFPRWKKNTFPRGIHPKENKGTGEKETRRIPFPPEVILHFGKNSVPCVKVGDEVFRGQKIAEAGGYMSVPVHASVTGKVKTIGFSLDADGFLSHSITITTSPTSVQSVVSGGAQNIDEMSREELWKAIQATGMVGLGGAGFPTHVKANPPAEYSIHTIIANGCECEPFLTTDHRVMIESISELLIGITIVMKTTGAKKAVIALESNTPDVLRAIRRVLPEDGSIAVIALEKKYPQGFEKMLTLAVLGIEIPARQIPASVGVGIFNVATLAQLGTLIPKNGGLIERVITVAGPAVLRPGNYLIPIGTSLKFILEHVGLSENVECVVLGGPMMGKTVSSLEPPVTKTTSGILAFGKREIIHEFPCIRCGACREICPMGLNPCELVLRAKKGRYEEMRDNFYLDLCCKCGSCVYTCPSGIQHLSLFKLAQEMNRKKKTENGK
jgi:electron transport complex protein RnfC